MKKEKPKSLLEQYSIAGACFFAGMFCIMAGAQFQGELLGKGRADIGINQLHITVSGDAAQININFFWIGAVVFFIAALFQLIITARREMKTPQRFGGFQVFMICPKCEKPFLIEDSEKKECPDCQVALVKLNGFYDKS